MIRKIVFATGNRKKLEEVRAMIKNDFELLTPKDIGCTEDIPEPFDTLEENSREKARYVFEKYGMNCFSEDTGLEVDALNGEPGVYSARYAGEERDDEKNMRLVLKKLTGKQNRGAQFRTVFTLILHGETRTFEGIVRGNIREQKAGSNGFGYDPIFEPLGYNKTFAELPQVEKNKISHRGIALRRLTSFLEKKIGN